MNNIVKVVSQWSSQHHGYIEYYLNKNNYVICALYPVNDSHDTMYEYYEFDVAGDLTYHKSKNGIFTTEDWYIIDSTTGNLMYHRRNYKSRNPNYSFDKSWYYDRYTKKIIYSYDNSNGTGRLYQYINDTLVEKYYDDGHVEYMTILCQNIGVSNGNSRELLTPGCRFVCKVKFTNKRIPLFDIELIDKELYYLEYIKKNNIINI